MSRRKRQKTGMINKEKENIKTKDKKWYGTPIKEKNQGRICSHVFVNWQQKVDIPCSFGRNRGKESY